MLSVRKLAVAAATVSLGLVACAQTPADHGAHRVESASAAGLPMGATAAPMTRMDEQMKVMQAMHDKMMQAQTPAQRNALIAAHRAVMQDSMALMGGMGMMGGMGGMGGMGHGGMMAGGAMGAMNGMKNPPDKGAMPNMPAMPGTGAADGGMGMHHPMMEKRMQMMQSMMQMMMDQMPAVPGKP